VTPAHRDSSEKALGTAGARTSFMMMRSLVSFVAMSSLVVACTVENKDGGRSGTSSSGSSTGTTTGTGTDTGDNSSVDVPGVGETGSTARTCAPGASCVCDGTGSCAYTCTGRGCTLVCQGTGSCNLECPQGGCTIECRAAGSCNISGCNGDGCTCKQTGTGTCDVN
jgi:hypothetical protein